MCVCSCLLLVSLVVMQTQRLCCYLPESNAGINIKAEWSSPFAFVCRPQSISQYLCEHRTRLNFALESPRMRVNVTGGYFPFFLYLMQSYRCKRRYFPSDESGAVRCTVGMLRIHFRFKISSQQWEFADKYKEIRLPWKAASSKSRSVFSRLVFLKLKPNIVIVTQKEQSAQFLPLCSLIISELI